MKFSDIEKYTSLGSYQVNCGWTYLESWVEDHSNKDIAGYELQLCPDFQRGHVWNEEQQIAYVEFKLRGGTAGNVLYFNCSSWMGGFNTPLQLVDGLQRITAVRLFLNNQIKAFGQYYTEFGDILHSMYPEFLINVNNLKTQKEVLQWYIELNEGGVVHTKEEINKVKLMLSKLH